MRPVASATPLRPAARLAFAAWLALAPAAAAQTPPPGSGALWVDVGADSTDVLDARVEVNVRAGNGTLVRLGTGGTYIPTATRDIEAGSVLVGALAGVDTPFSAGGSYEYWGQTETLKTHTVTGHFTWRGPRGTVSLRPQGRRIVVTRRVAGAIERDVGVGRGIDLAGTLYGPGTWEWTVGAAAWGYTGAESQLTVATVDTRTLTTRVVDARVAAVRLDSQLLAAPAAGFLERRLSAEVARGLGPARVGLEGSLTRYVADDRATYGGAASLYLPVSRRHALELRAGRLVGGDLGSVTYGRIAVGYGW